MTWRDPVLTAAHDFRDAVNRSTVKAKLMQDRQSWAQLCSAMDVIQDTQCAIRAWAVGPSPDDLGERYLRVYGVLQAFFLQQDAVKHAAEAIGSEWTPPDELREIRMIRNQAVGHPTKQGKEDSSFGIVQMSLGTGSFELYAFGASRTGDDFRRRIDLHRLSDQQAATVCDALSVLTGRLLNT